MTEVITIDPITTALWEHQGREYFNYDRAGMEESVARVNRGAVLLDEARPDWVGKILPARLDMSNGGFCVIGQVYGDFGEHVGIPFGMDVYDELNDVSLIDLPDSEITLHAISHGFLTEDTDDVVVPYPLLDRTWVTMLMERSQKKRALTLTLPSPLPEKIAEQLLDENGLLNDYTTLNHRN